MQRRWLVVLMALAVAAAACATVDRLWGPLRGGPPTPTIQCTPPLCPDGEVFHCPDPNGCPGGCGTGCATPTPDPNQPTGAPTAATPMIMCTPPQCQAGEVFYCPSGDCPGGCGTGCATPTPVTPVAALCQPVVRTPPPEAPTASVNGTPDPNHRVDPHVALCATTTQAAVGDRVALVARAVDIGVPIYQVSVRTDGQGDFEPVLTVSDRGEVTLLAARSPALDYAGAQTDTGVVALHWQAAAPGRVEIIVSATGEIHYGYPGPATWGGGASEVLVITVAGAP